MAPWQRAVHSDPSDCRFIRAANKIGKTFLIVAECDLACRGIHPWLRFTPPVHLVFIIPDLDSSYADNICRRYRELLPDSQLDEKCKYTIERGFLTSGRRMIKYANGSTVMFRSGYQGGESLAGISGDLIVIDEPPREDRFGEIMRASAEFKSPILMAFTPMDTHGVTRDLRWLRKEIERSDSVWSEHVIPLSPETVPHRSAEAVQAQIERCPAEEVPQRIYGEWDGAVGFRHLDGFDNACVVKKSPDVQATFRLAWDHGELPGKEVCLFITLWTEKGQPHAHVFDEYSSGGRSTTTTDALRVTEKIESHGMTLFHVDEAYGDINTSGKSEVSTVNQDLEVAFANILGLDWSHPPFEVLRPNKGPGSVDYGCRVINAAFIKGNLTIHERCTLLRRALGRWVGGKTGEQGDFKDFIDGLRYGVVDHLKNLVTYDVRVG
jgi:hypothetical protein